MAGDNREEGVEIIPAGYIPEITIIYNRNTTLVFARVQGIDWKGNVRVAKLPVFTAAYRDGRRGPMLQKPG